MKGLLASCLVDSKGLDHIYGAHSTVDLENAIRRSEIELSNYELKQGLLSLSGKRKIDQNIITKVVNTICAMANNGPKNIGKVIIGVTDSDSDSERVENLDNISAKKIGKRFIVGVKREAELLGITVEDYFSKWKDGIRNSQLSDDLKSDVLSNIDFHDFYGYGLITITVPSQKEISYVGEDTFWRNCDSTEKATSPKLVSSITKRFS